MFGERVKLKVVQNESARSEETLDGEPGVQPRAEDFDHIEFKEEQVQNLGIRASLHTVFSWENYRVYLVTSWIFNAFTYLGSFFNLYLWNIIPSLVLIGAINTITAAIGTTARFFGGYVGDTMNRKTLAVVSMLIMAVYYLMIGIFTDPLLIFVALTIYVSAEITKGGSTAYIMDNIPREHSGLALSLFTAGRVLSIVTLAVFGILYPLMEFAGFRLLHLAGGILLLVSTAVRAAYLKGGQQKRREHGTRLWRAFIDDNRRALRILISIIPGMIIVCVFDSISDSFFKLLYRFTDCFPPTDCQS